MSIRRAVVLLATLLGAGPALAGPGIPIGHDDTIYTEDLLLASAPKKVEVVITARGPEPRDILIDRAEKLTLLVHRESERACRFGLAVSGYGPARPVGSDRPAEITILAYGKGAVHLSCPAEDEAEDLGG
ncbi:MAG TPA: hypothetical protein VMG32_11810 [Anaeromyxobacteraceae bacterium]|nr:hypothetical protein [Anaeromyxobacteraceae bacterium]